MPKLWTNKIKTNHNSFWNKCNQILKIVATLELQTNCLPAAGHSEVLVTTTTTRRNTTSQMSKLFMEIWRGLNFHGNMRTCTFLWISLGNSTALIRIVSFFFSNVNCKLTWKNLMDGNSWRDTRCRFNYGLFLMFQMGLGLLLPFTSFVHWWNSFHK